MDEKKLMDSLNMEDEELEDFEIEALFDAVDKIANGEEPDDLPEKNKNDDLHAANSEYKENQTEEIAENPIEHQGEIEEIDLADISSIDDLLGTKEEKLREKSISADTEEDAEKEDAEDVDLFALLNGMSDESEDLKEIEELLQKSDNNELIAPIELADDKVESTYEEASDREDTPDVEDHEEQVEGKKKKKEKRVKEKKVKEKNEQGFFSKLFQALTAEEEMEEVDENEQILKELEAEDRKKNKKSKPSKKEKKDKAPILDENGNEIEESGKKKKAKKEKVKKEKPKKVKPVAIEEERNGKKISKNSILLVFLFSAAVLAVLLVVGLVISPMMTKKAVISAYENQDYLTYYNALYGHNRNAKEELMFQHAEMILRTERLFAAHARYKKQGKSLEALDSLMQVISNYYEKSEEASNCGATTEMTNYYEIALQLLYEEFGIENEEALKIALDKDDVSYTRILTNIVNGEEYTTSTDTEISHNGEDDLIPGEE